ncbi:hypothetical protein ACROYT_G019899 [Oculina patagonica]
MASCDKNRLSPAQQNSKIPVRKATCLSSGSGKSSSSKDEANKKQRIPDSVEKFPQNKRPSRIPIVDLQKNSKTGGKRPLGKDSGINLQEIRGKQGAKVTTNGNTPHADKRSNPNPATKSTVAVRRRTPVNTPLTNQVSSCEEIHKKELEQLEKENSEIIEELQVWVENGDQKNKTLEEIIEKTNEENVKLLVQISVMKKEMKDLQEKNNTLQNELETKSFQVDALEKDLAHFKTCELDYRKLKEQTSRLIDQLEVQLNTFIDESARVISEKDNEINELKEEKMAVINKLEDQLASLTKENARITSEKIQEINEKTEAINQLEDQLATLMKENTKIMFEKGKELNERIQEEKSKV